MWCLQVVQRCQKLEETPCIVVELGSYLGVFCQENMLRNLEEMRSSDEEMPFAMSGFHPQIEDESDGG